MDDPWQNGHPYERFMGRWSALIGHPFLDWLAVPPALGWLDLGCGTGSLTRLISARHYPARIISIDASPAFAALARHQIPQPSVRFVVGLAQAIPLASHSVDAAVSGLMLNFVPQPASVVAEMIRVTRPGGRIGIFVWDYAEGMEMLRIFWDAAIELFPQAAALDEGQRFPLCHEQALDALLQKTALEHVAVKALEVTTIFSSFDDYWQPFLGKVGPAPQFVSTLSKAEQQRLAERLREVLPIQSNGTIALQAKAWAAKATTPLK